MVLCCLAVKALYVMGGSAHKGNITPTAEFNFHCDPEAAHLVLKKVVPLWSLFSDWQFMSSEKGFTVMYKAAWQHFVSRSHRKIRVFATRHKLMS